MCYNVVHMSHADFFITFGNIGKKAALIFWRCCQVLLNLNISFLLKSVIPVIRESLGCDEIS